MQHTVFFAADFQRACVLLELPAFECSQFLSTALAKSHTNEKHDMHGYAWKKGQRRKDNGDMETIESHVKANIYWNITIHS